jgi:hypothetical protein
VSRRGLLAALAGVTGLEGVDGADIKGAIGVDPLALGIGRNLLFGISKSGIGFAQPDYRLVLSVRII